MKTIIKRRVTEFFKSAIFCVIMGLSENFTVRALKCRSYGKHYIESRLPENDDFTAFDSILQIGHRFLRNGVQQEF